MKDYYATLEINPDAGPGEVAAAYRKLAFIWHPDRNPHRSAEAHRRFLELGEAVAVLADPAARRHYDRVRGLRGAGGQGGASSRVRGFARQGRRGRRFARSGLGVDAELFVEVVGGGPAPEARQREDHEARIRTLMTQMAAGDLAYTVQHTLFRGLALAIPLAGIPLAGVFLGSRPLDLALAVLSALLLGGAAWWWSKSLLPRRAARYRELAEHVASRPGAPGALHGGDPDTPGTFV